MPIPDFQSMMLPLVSLLGDGRDWGNKELAAALAERLGISDEDLRVRTPSGKVARFVNHIAWAKSHLKRAGLLESPARGIVRITSRGREALSETPARIDLRCLKRFPEYERKPDGPAEEATLPPELQQTPEVTIDACHRALRQVLAEELLERVRQCSPLFFEQLVIELLVAMGYGGSLDDAGQRIGRAGDGGIDGIIKEDKLGLDVVCVQAKRWEGTVGRPDVQAFAGSMEGRRARKAVLITTSSFSKDAQEYVRTIERKIVLVDGPALVGLMIDHGLGVSTTQTYLIKRIDHDYFAEDLG
jgi:restriction system protein